MVANVCNHVAEVHINEQYLKLKTFTFWVLVPPTAISYVIKVNTGNYISYPHTEVFQKKFPYNWRTNELMFFWHIVNDISTFSIWSLQINYNSKVSSENSLRSMGKSLLGIQIFHDISSAEQFILFITRKAPPPTVSLSKPTVYNIYLHA